jgi:hypothetical protein
MALSENEICGKKEWIKAGRFPQPHPAFVHEKPFFVQITLSDRLFAPDLIIWFAQFSLLSDFYCKYQDHSGQLMPPCPIEKPYRRKPVRLSSCLFFIVLPV